jgi:cytochrome P450
MADFTTGFLSPDFIQNPYPYYFQLRSTAPISYQERWNAWFLTDYEDVNGLLRDRRFGRADPPGSPKRQLPQDEFKTLGDHTVMDMEPPDHTRIRALVQNVFTPRRVESLRGKIQELTDRILDSAGQTGQLDLVHGLTEPISVTVIAELMGVPEAERLNLRPWSRDITAMFELAPTADDRQRANRAVREFSAMINEMVEQRLRQPTEDLVSALAAAEQSGQVSRAEVTATCILLLNAGHEATVNATGNGMLALLQRPEQYRLLCENPGLLRQAVEEMLRYDTPLHLFHRWAKEDVEYKGRPFRAGDRLWLLYGAANRDPKRFPNPDEFDITRQENPHLTFGAGIHYCVGAPLARMELAVSIGSLLARFPALRLIEEKPEYRETFVIRGLKRLEAAV